MATTYLKRIAAPKTWPILRKQRVFITRPLPSGHGMDLTLPLVVIARDMLGLVETAQQLRTIVRETPITVNGLRVFDPKSSVGFMDVLTIGKDSYRLLINRNNTLTLEPVAKGEEFTLQRVRSKTLIRGGKIQINCQGGMNVLVAKDEYKVGDSIALALDDKKKIKAHYALEQGAVVLVTSGAHIGKVGKIVTLVGDTVTIDVDETQIQTRKENAYVLGKGKSAITITG